MQNVTSKEIKYLVKSQYNGIIKTETATIQKDRIYLSS